MPMYNIRQSKAYLSRLVEKALSGEEVIITRAGKPVARLVPIARYAEPRIPSMDKGKIQIAPDFDARLPEFDQA